MIKVYSLVSDEEYHFAGLSAEDALISAYLLGYKMVSFLNDQNKRDELKQLISKSGKFLNLGDWCVSRES